MKKKEYLIGDVAAITGVSRDTLRFYEKKGLISVRKKDNGYRYYSEHDIFELSSIFYHRKMNIGLEEIEHLWTGDTTLEKTAQVTKQQIEAEQEQILKHQKVLTRLRLYQEGCQKIEQCLNQISVKPFPRAYLIETCDSPQEGVIAWFSQSQKDLGLDMMCHYNTYIYEDQEDGGSLTFQYSSLLFYDKLKDHLASSFDLSTLPMTGISDCLYTIVESPDRVPSPDTVKTIIEWGKQHSIHVGNQIVSDYIMHGMQDGITTHYLELYIPILSS